MTNEWRLVSDDGSTRRYELELDEHQTLVRTEFYAADTFYGANKALRDESDGHRFGDGQIVASIPMAVWAESLALPMKEGDVPWVRRFLNDADNRAYRTFRGRV